LAGIKRKLEEEGDSDAEKPELSGMYTFKAWLIEWLIPAAL